MILKGLYQQMLLSAAVSSLLAQPAKNSIFENVAVKQAGRPFVVLNVVDGPPAEASHDGISDLIDAEIQFDSYADDQPTARRVSRAVRDYLMKTFNAGALPDGTMIQFVDVTMDRDEPYEEGGAGYLSRALIRLRAFYTENVS